MKIKVLAVGNSFSDNALRYFTQIVQSVKPCETRAQNVFIGGCPFDKHLTLARFHEAAPEEPEWKPYPFEGRTASLKELLLLDKWDVITIQQFSGWSFKPETYRPHAKNLVDYIRGYRPHSEIAVHQTWAYRNDNANVFKNGFTSTAMYRGLTKAYRGLAEELGLKRVIPVGDAFQLVEEARPFKIDPDFDPSKGVLPEQPESIHTGWRFDKEGKLGYDHGHANARGCYLAGLVWFGNLFGKDPREVSFVPEGVEPSDAAFLREIAAKTCLGVKPAAYPL